MAKCGHSSAVVLVYASLLVATCSSAQEPQTSNCTGPNASDDLPARYELNQGVEAYKAARYSDAINHFQKAVEDAPCLTSARAYLGTALAQNVVPGLDTPDNLKIAHQAIDSFQIVLAQNPHDINSLKQVAGIYFSIERFDDARDWQKKVLVEDHNDYEAAYTIGVIDWTQAHQNSLAALQSAGLNDDGMGNTKAPPSILETIKQQNSALIAEALDYLNQAIANHPNFADAMAYINLVYRRKADIDFDNPALRDDDIAKANDWARKSMLARETEEKKLASPDSPQP